MSEPKWLGWAKRMQAIAQNGLAYCENEFDIERYQQLRSLALEIMEDHSDASMPELEKLFEEERGYATPKVDVRGGVFRDHEVLLVKEKLDGLWTLPGGWADPYDTPREAIEREIREEAGFQTRVSKLAAVLDRNKQGHPYFPFHVYKLHFVCELVSQERLPLCHEVEDVGFFDLDQLPPLSLGRVLPDQILRLYEHYRHPEWSTYVD